MSTDSDLRQRTATKEAVANGKTTPAQKEQHRAKKQAEVEKTGMTMLEFVRILVALTLVSTLASYLVTRGESMIWGLKRPWWTKPKMIQSAMTPKLYLTNEELAAYDGSDPEKPILLALNRTIYDVSASPHVYGPNGMYSKLAAKDASRSYVTTCFDPVQDLVPYLSGVEEVFVPLWLSNKGTQAEYDAIAKGEVMEGMGMQGLIDKVQKSVGRKKTRLMREEAYEDAREKVRQKIKTWEGMFEKKEYPVVGYVVGVDESDESKWKHLTFCDEALAQRPPLTDSLTQVMKAAGSPDGKLDLGMMKKRTQNKAGKFDSQDIRNAKERRDREKAQARHEDMSEEGKYGPGGQAKREAEERSQERERRRQEKKAENAAKKARGDDDGEVE